MRAMTMREFGDPGVLEAAEVSGPVAADGELLVEVRAVGINPIDCTARRVGGPLKEIVTEAMPAILGWDIAGVVVGSRSEAFAAGDRIHALSRFPQLAGGYAELASVPANEAVAIPANLSFEEAAAVPLAALTAWQALVDNAQVREGQRVLVHAAAGGVGHLAVQIAKLRGAHVIATASPANFDYLAGLGADECVDYNAGPVGEQVSDMDLVLHALEPARMASESLPCLKPGGLLLSLRGPAPEDVLSRFDAACVPVFVRPNGPQLAEIGGLLEREEIKVTVSRTFDLENVEAAHRQIETSHTRGKVVLTV